MNIQPKKVGSFTLKDGRTLDAYNCCTTDGYTFYYQNEVLAWKCFALAEIQDFGQLNRPGSFPSTILN
ncbi:MULTISPECIES: hypothetical protein [Desulfitobacterium]|uniref:Uncharacterized protein n=1 Tax=Desulfitobacterium metallireducens DSM 15288 TaxID=871968 RepID=W0EGX0_9FIRM|nr:hypothetical protein [Desulfitobacterium metallireducens]AHF08454.1 hypothetical protein DESME_03305 [Desulfitobacterium metallireducens DSM 15288]